MNNSQYPQMIGRMKLPQTSNKNKLAEGDLNWTNLYSLQGGTNNCLYTPFTDPSRGSITS
jgi:hypothetical protein